MHDAYEPLTILERFPLHIESVTSYDENLVVGTRQGHLLMYSISSDSSNRIKINLLRSNKNFSRKPINQIAVVPEHQILISLSDQLISVHDLTIFNFPLMTSLPKTKGAVAFDLDVKRHTSLTGEAVVTVRLVVAVRRKLQLYYWKLRQFHELREELTLPDLPRCLMWFGEAVAVGFRHDYWIVKLTGDQKELFATGKSHEPLLMKMPDDSLALARDENTIFVDTEGKAACDYMLEWIEQPIAMAYDDPYIIGVLSKCVQILSQDPKLNIQKIPLEKPRLITSTLNSKNQNQVFVASESHIWCLCLVPFSQQIPQLLVENQFQLALKLVDLWKENSQSKNQMKQHIEKLHALHLFCLGHFSEAMQLFTSLNTDLLFVIGLYPGLVPEEYRNRLQYPHPIPPLAEDKLIVALQELIHFLLQMRHKLGGSTDKPDVELNASPSLKSKSQKLQIIDTTLLKCYLKTNDSLILPLLRMPDSRVSVEEAERVFRQAQKYSELVLLLQTRGLHSRALQLLLRHSKRQESPLNGHLHTVKYLQELGPSHIDLIFEYGGWVLKSYPEDGLKIFTGEGSSGEVELLPRTRVLSFIRKTKKSLVIPYLEHVIWEWGDTTPILHNELIHQYRDVLINSPNEAVDASSHSIWKSDIREKLLKFLKVSTCYTAATILVHFPQNDLYEEKAVLLGRLGQHEQGLRIYTDVLDDVERAIEYCHSHYSPSGEDSKVYILLLKLLITSSGSSWNSSRKCSPSGNSLRCETDYVKNEETILNILNNYAHCIDVEQALKYFPSDMNICILKSYINKSLTHLAMINKENQVSRGLSKALGEQAKAELAVHQLRKIEVSDYSICSVCLKKFTTSCAFAWNSRAEIFHFSCKDQKMRR